MLVEYGSIKCRLNVWVSGVSVKFKSVICVGGVSSVELGRWSRNWWHSSRLSRVGGVRSVELGRWSWGRLSLVGGDVSVESELVELGR